MTKHIIDVEDRQFIFDKDHTPVARIQPGDQVVFNTVDCFSGQIKSEEDLVSGLDFDQVNPGTGPVYVEGAEVGDIIAVHVDDVAVAD